MELLWPELTATAAQNNLHQALHAARRALGATASLSATAWSRSTPTGAVHGEREGRCDDRRGDHGQARRQLRLAHARLGRRSRDDGRDAHRVRPTVAKCAAQRVSKGQSFIEPANHIHMARNEGTKPATLYAFYLGLPSGAQANRPGATPTGCTS